MSLFGRILLRRHIVINALRVFLVVGLLLNVINQGSAFHGWAGDSLGAGDERPAAWFAPMESVKNDHFWRVFETCLSGGLQENQARLFMMREFLEKLY